MSIFSFCFPLYKHRGQTTKRESTNMARVLISMPEEFLSKIDEVAQDENRTRSELIRNALRTYIQRNQLRDDAIANKNAEILEALLD